MLRRVAGKRVSHPSVKRKWDDTSVQTATLSPAWSFGLNQGKTFVRMTSSEAANGESRLKLEAEMKFRIPRVGVVLAQVLLVAGSVLAQTSTLSPSAVPGALSDDSPDSGCIGRTNNCFEAASGICVGGDLDGTPCEIEPPCIPGFNDCCVQGGVCTGQPGCADPDCCTIVCDANPTCCSQHWLASCANIAWVTCSGCGNNFIEPGEECDDGLSNSDSLPDACRTDCTLPTCGDNVKDATEVCDGTDLGDCPGPCGDDCTCFPVGIPTVSAWGLTALTLTLLAVARVYFGRRSARRLVP